MQLFSKTNQSAGKLFNKVGQGHELLRKMSHVVGTINKVGSFLSPMVSSHHRSNNNNPTNYNSLERAVRPDNQQNNMYN